MNGNFFYKSASAKAKKRIFIFVWIFALIFALSFLCSCTQKTDYFSYVTELRDNIFIGENERFIVRAYSLTRESPYVADGIPCEKQTRTEVYILAKGIDENMNVSFQINDNVYGGEASYDNVKGEYFLACPVSTATLRCIEFSICFANEEIRISANSVCPPETLDAKAVLNVVMEEDAELFTSLTDKYGFAGEIYMRLLYEDAPFYYVGVINRKGDVTAFLINAITGRVLAKRTQ